MYVWVLKFIYLRKFISINGVFSERKIAEQMKSIELNGLQGCKFV